MQKKQNNILYIFILLQPLIDLITSVMTEIFKFDITLGVIIRGIAFIISVIYILFLTKSKYKKPSRIYLLSLGIYMVFYFLTKQSLFNNYSQLFTEVMYAFKYFYTVITLVGLLNIYDEYKPNNRKIFKILQINLFIYCFIIFLANITGTAFSTYTEPGFGNTGWFYSGNEISVTVALLFPFLYLLINKSTSYKALLYIIPIIFGIEFIGTKTSMLGLILPTLIFLFYYLIRIKQGKKRQFVMVLIVLAIIIISAPNLPVIDNIKDNIYKFQQRMLNKDLDEDYSDKMMSSILFSNRDYYHKKISKIYKKSSISNKLLGIGFTNREEINNKNIEKIIEMDPYDIYYRYGVIGTIIYFFPFLLITIYVFSRIIQLKFRINQKQLTLLYISYIGLIVSTMSGHILGSPAVSIYLDISFILLLYYLKYGYHQIDIDSNKITFLSTNIDQNTENYLSNIMKIVKKDYQIDLVVTYKDDQEKTYKLNNKVNMNYLINEVPPKEELKKALEKKDYLRIIKYSYKILKLYIKSYFKNVLYIEEINSKYIVINNYRFNKLVGRNKNRDCISIDVENDYEKAEKYIKKISSSCNNIDYLILPSIELKDEYDKNLHEFNTKTVYIPNKDQDKLAFRQKWTDMFMQNVDEESEE